jgi:TctA family transporter
MDTMVFYLALFLAGIVVDVLYTLLVTAIATGRAGTAALWQLLFTIVVVWATVQVAESKSLAELLAYAAGGALGTWLVVVRNNERLSRRK